MTLFYIEQDNIALNGVTVNQQTTSIGSFDFSTLPSAGAETTVTLISTVLFYNALHAATYSRVVGIFKKVSGTISQISSTIAEIPNTGDSASNISFQYGIAGQQIFFRAVAAAGTTTTYTYGGIMEVNVIQWV